MSKIVLIKENEIELFDSMKDMFQSMSEKGDFVISLEDGKLKTKDKEFEYGYLSIEDTANKFKEEVSTYREELRASVALLKKQGIGVSKTELNKLAKQFEFLNEVPSIKEPEDEIPV